MALETAAIEHTCNTVRRQIQEEFPDLTLSFIVYGPGKLTKAIDHKRQELESHPVGPAIIPLLKKANPDKTPFVMTSAKEKKLLSFLTREKTLACIFLKDNGSHMDADQMRRHAFELAWHALHKIIDKDNTLTADEQGFAWHNMLADCFSAIVLEMQGKKGSIRTLARRRGSSALEAQPDYNAEHYPFPVVMDAAQLVYDDMRKSGNLSKAKLFTRALEMTREIGITFDRSMVLQWQAFAKPAQEMAWLGIDKTKILGAAVHTSEDPYARSTAYLMAEILNIEPAPVTDISLYNAFTDQEANERHHRKICEDILQNLLSKRETGSNGTIFRTEAIKQNQKLLEGQLIGWCAPALILAADIFDKNISENAKVEEAKRIFTEASKKTNSEVLRILGMILTSLRRESGNITIEHLAEAVLNDEHVYIQDLSDALLLKAH
jgi:hypothetical protein